MRSKEEFFKEVVNNWKKEQCMKYLSDLNLGQLKDLCVERLEWDFSDCETESDVKNIDGVNLEYIKNPLNED